MALGQIQTFNTQNPGQCFFLDLPQEVKNNVYQKCFEDHEQYVKLNVYFHDGHYIAIPIRGRRFRGIPWTFISASWPNMSLLNTPPSSTISLLSTSHAIYTESLPHLYDGIVFMLSHSALVNLSLNIKSYIRHLDTSGMYLAGIIGRGDAPRSSIWLNEIWSDIMHQLSCLESLTFDCAFARLACLLRQITKNIIPQPDHPQVLLKLTIRGKHAGNLQVNLVSDAQLADGEYRCYVPPVKKIIITAEVSQKERLFIQGLDLGTLKLWHLGEKSVENGRIQHTYRLVEKDFTIVAHGLV